MMAVDRRRKDRNWVVTDEQGNTYSDIKEGVYLALLMDIRDELQKLNALLHCTNFVDIPNRLGQIVDNTRKRKYTRKEVKA